MQLNDDQEVYSTDGEDVCESGLLVTAETVEKMMNDIPDVTDEQLAMAIEHRNKMEAMKAARLVEAEGAAAHLKINSEQGGGWRMGS